MDPTTLYKCRSCMGHFLEPRRAENCHGTGHVEVYFCNECSVRYMDFQEAVACCDPRNVNANSPAPPHQPSV